MSTAVEHPHPAAEHKKHKSKKDKSKDKSKDKKREKKANKKRRHEEINGTEGEVAPPAESSPTKRQRTETEAASPPSHIQVPDSQIPPSQDLESPFFSITASIRVSVPPVAQSYPLEGVCADCLSPLLLTYHSKLKGIVMSYNNARLSSSPPPNTSSKRPKLEEEPEDGADDELGPLAKAYDEYAAPFIWVSAQFLVFRARKGIELEGQINLQNESHIGLILWNVFSVSIEKKRLPSTWSWFEITDGDNEHATAGAYAEEEQPMKRQNEVWGNWQDDKGNVVEGMLRFRVKDFDVTRPDKDGEQSTLSIEGTLLDEEGERALEEAEAEAAVREKQRAGSRTSSRAGTPLRSSSVAPTAITGARANGVGVASSSRR